MRRARPHGPSVDNPSAHSEALARHGVPTRRSNTPRSTTLPPASGMAIRSSVRGNHDGAKRGTSARRWHACDGQHVLERGPRPGPERAHAVDHLVHPRRRERAEGLGQWRRDGTRGHEMPEEGMHEPAREVGRFLTLVARHVGWRAGRHEPGGVPRRRRGPSTSGALVVVPARCDAPRRVLEPRPQSPCQARVEAWPRRTDAAQQSQHFVRSALAARVRRAPPWCALRTAAILRRRDPCHWSERRPGVRNRFGCREDHRGSVAAWCDI